MVADHNGTDLGGEGLILIVGSGFPFYRQYFIETAGAAHRLWLLDATEPTWQRGHVEGGSIVDPYDVDALVAAGRAIDAERGVSGVICYDEGLIVPAAHLAAALGVPTAPPAAVQACRDKYATRRLLAERGIAQPRSQAVRSFDEAAAVAADVGYPLVLKPRGLGASRGVVRVDTADELRSAYTDAAAASFPNVPVYDDGVLVEEFVGGAEISVDAAIVHGRYEPLYLARKHVGYPPFFEELGHTVDGDDPLLRDEELLALLAGSHEALGFDHGMTHTEVKLDPAGYRLIEVNGRMGGDFIPYLGWFATGVHPADVACDVALGRQPHVERTQRRVAAIRFLYPPHDCRVDAVDIDPALLVAGDGEEVQAHRMVEPGRELRLPPGGYADRYAYVLAVAADEGRCHQLLDDTERAVHLRSTPLAPVDG